MRESKSVYPMLMYVIIFDFLLIQFHTKKLRLAHTYTLSVSYTKIQINNEQKSQREWLNEWNSTTTMRVSEWEWKRKITWWKYLCRSPSPTIPSPCVGFSGLLNMPHFYFSTLMFLLLFLAHCCWQCWWWWWCCCIVALCQPL